VSPFEPERPSGPRPIDGSLEAISRRFGLEEARFSAQIFARWEEIVGPDMAAHVQPVRLTPDVLVVSCDHPAWATQVRRLADTLLDRVAAEVGVARPGSVEVRIQR
jgi:predicted nucleic acid-binding Zn ribbon protein